MQRGAVYCNGRLAGYIEKEDGYRFVYEQEYFDDPLTHAISITLPKTQKEFKSEQLFLFGRAFNGGHK
ncbi:hypothetical protein DHW03_08065 [Pedobacter yonginense]|uniref:HipA N-terminal subdomain 1 domain-containing protein n=1 Tax=Pedobacter yonginense TaxID=651869 RepID=A0A317EL17_9SPHI|nr:HipA N-terminal domain-containing protein [Pedobacter yonginense]PWS27540.1 hypothetical protein DHW03_08065 [Pedobacter yonginense]